MSCQQTALRLRHTRCFAETQLSHDVARCEKSPHASVEDYPPAMTVKGNSPKIRKQMKFEPRPKGRQLRSTR